MRFGALMDRKREGDAREDLRMGVLATTVVKLLGGKSSKVTPEMFCADSGILRKLRGPTREPWREQLAKVEMWTSVLGGEDKRSGGA